MDETIAGTSSKVREDLGQLSHAPLARVLCQVRWPSLSKFDIKSVSRDFGNLIGDDYPFTSQKQESLIMINPAGAVQQTATGSAVFRYENLNRAVAVSLGETFLSLETSAYNGHDDFIKRFADLSVALQKVAKIPSIERVGYRYTNRLDDPHDLERLSNYFAPSILGGLAQGDRSDVLQTVTETLFSQPATQMDTRFLIVRSALLAPGASIDPTLTPVNQKSWVVDLDSYIGPQISMQLSDVCEELEVLSDRASKHFLKSLVLPAFWGRFK